jgi:hypothetical protein
MIDIPSAAQSVPVSPFARLASVSFDMLDSDFAEKIALECANLLNQVPDSIRKFRFVVSFTRPSTADSATMLKLSTEFDPVEAWDLERRTVNRNRDKD